jgi:hypothetical protein
LHYEVNFGIDSAKKGFIIVLYQKTQPQEIYMPTITKDQIIMILTFAAGVLTLLATQAFVTPEIQPYILFAVGVINLALSVFFGIAKPIFKSYYTGRAELQSEMDAKAK